MIIEFYIEITKEVIMSDDELAELVRQEEERLYDEHEHMMQNQEYALSYTTDKYELSLMFDTLESACKELKEYGHNYSPIELMGELQ